MSDYPCTLRLGHMLTDLSLSEAVKDYYELRHAVDSMLLTKIDPADNNFREVVIDLICILIRAIWCYRTTEREN